MPLQLPAPRWALTPPFHPYQPKLAVSFLLRYPSHLAVRPGVTRSPVLRRPDFPHSRADPGCAAIRRALQLQFGEALEPMQARIEVSAACTWGAEWYCLTTHCLAARRILKARIRRIDVRVVAHQPAESNQLRLTRDEIGRLILRP